MTIEQPALAPFDLEGRVAIVTGGSRGIGKAIASGFASLGGHVVIASRKSDACDAAVAEISAAGGSALAVPTHVGDVDQLDALVAATVERFGGVDIVVNDAANPLALPIGSITPEALAKSHEVNLRGPLFLVQAALPHLRAERPRGDRERDHCGGVHQRGLPLDVRRREVRPAVHDPLDGRRARARRHPGQRARPRHGPHRHGRGDARGVRAGRRRRAAHQAHARSPPRWCPLRCSWRATPRRS